MPRIPTTRRATPIVADVAPRATAPPRLDRSFGRGLSDVGDALFKIGMREQALINQADEVSARADLDSFLYGYRERIRAANITGKDEFESLQQGFASEWNERVKGVSKGLAREVQGSIANYAKAQFPAAEFSIGSEIFSKRVPYYQQEFRVKHLEAIRTNPNVANELVTQYRQWFNEGEIESIALENQLYVGAMGQESPAAAKKFVKGKGLSLKEEIRLGNMVESEKRDELVEQQKVSNALVEDVLKKAQTMNLPEFRSELVGTVGISEQQKTDLLTMFISAQKKWQDTGVNYWDKTRDWDSFIEIYHGMVSGKQYTEKEILDRQMSEPKVGPKWSYGQMMFLVNRAKSGSTTEDASYVAAEKTFGELIKGMPNYAVEKPLHLYMAEIGSRELFDWYTAAESPTDRDVKDKAFRIYLNLQERYDAGEIELSAFAIDGPLSPENVPLGKTLGLDAIWSELNEEEMRTAIRALRMGKTPQEIIDYFNRDKK